MTRSVDLADLPIKKYTMQAQKPAVSYPYLAAWSNNAQFVIPSVLSRVITNFLCMNASSKASTLRPRLFMFIQGPPREGKTFNATHVATRLGYNVFAVGSAELSGKHENDAGRVFLDIYDQAKSLQVSSGQHSVLIIDDIDVSVVAIREAVGHTINTELLNATLQHLSDHPPNPRVPIIFTGNDSTVFRKPLLERMELFTWQPSYRDKCDMARYFFALSGPLQRCLFGLLVLYYHFRGEPFEFFVRLGEDYLRDLIPPYSPAWRTIDRAVAVFDEQLERVGIKSVGTSQKVEVKLLRLLALAHARHGRQPKRFA